MLVHNLILLWCLNLANDFLSFEIYFKFKNKVNKEIGNHFQVNNQCKKKKK